MTERNRVKANTITYLLYDSSLSHKSSTQCFAFDCWYTEKYALEGTGVLIKCEVESWKLAEHVHSLLFNFGMDCLLKHSWSFPSVLLHQAHWLFFVHDSEENSEGQFGPPNPKATIGNRNKSLANMIVGFFLGSSSFSPSCKLLLYSKTIFIIYKILT
jgi:hypothetical protein